MARNSFFKFKQFTVLQDRCAMKVCTDACVLGAWADIESAQKILDIGAGTGLLSLMVAQRDAARRDASRRGAAQTHQPALISAVELNEEAFIQAKENIASSPFKDQITVFHTAIQHFSPAEKFDCIITNPPFFQSDLRSPDAKINQAHHSESLNFEDLLDAADRLLHENGKWNILLPVVEGIAFRDQAEKAGWFLTQKLTLFHQNGKKPFRSLMVFQRREMADSAVISADLFIYEQDGKTHHAQFRELMKDYYLIF